MNRLFSMRWVRGGLLPAGHTLIGIDEQTALLANNGAWRPIGRGRVLLVDDQFRTQSLTQEIT
jgi:hypothetical protein